MKIPIAGCDWDASYITSWATGEALCLPNHPFSGYKEENNKIEIHWNSEIQEIKGNDSVEGIDIINNVTNETKNISLGGVFIAIGHQPNTDIFKEYLKLDESGYIVTKPGSTETNVPGVFATGDAQDKIYRQAVTAAGSGCMGALDA